MGIITSLMNWPENINDSNGDIIKVAFTGRVLVFIRASRRVNTIMSVLHTIQAHCNCTWAVLNLLTEKYTEKRIRILPYPL